jgi:hypothetical protein
MDKNHITKILDDKPLTALSESELAVMRAHIAGCNDCARSFEAAQLSGLLLKERTSEAAQSALNANPFFQTRVLAAWREQQATAGAWGLRRLWNTTGALISSMVATTAVLAALAFVIPAEESAAQTAALVPSSAESVMLDQGEEEMTNEQALSAIYYDEEAR